MNLTDETKSGVDVIQVTDSLTAPLLGLNLVVTESTTIPEENRIIVYVDKSGANTPTDARRSYVFDIASVLSVGDVFKIEPSFERNDVVMKAKISRQLDESVEELEYLPIMLFEGENYIYTNHAGISISLIYPKDTEFNRNYVNSSLYYLHKMNNNGEFSLDDIYFKDAFTKTEDKLNLEVNNATIDCLTSKSNKFSLDADGNLTVNSIATKSGGIDLLAMYPVGSIYMSVNNVNPNNYFGGTWEAWGAGKVPVGVDTTQTEFNTVEKMGGEKTHTLSVDEIPSHSHGMSSSGAHTHTYTGFIQCAVTSSATYTAIAHKRFNSDGTSTPASMNSSGAHTHTINNSGGSKAHNNLQPYITCYMWKRTA